MTTTTFTTLTTLQEYDWWTLGVPAMLVAVALLIVAYGVWMYRSADADDDDDDNNVPKKKASASLQPTKPPRDRALKMCPFTAETDFLVETAPHLNPAPLDLFADWIDEDAQAAAEAAAASAGNKSQSPPRPRPRPLAARWLNAGISGQDTPGVLRAGLKRLKDQTWFTVVEPGRMRDELYLKQAALDDAERRKKVLVAEDDSLPAQQEVLDLFLHYLPKRYPEMYDYDEAEGTITVVPFDNRTFRIADYQQCPLELCERIMQEDLVLMRPAKPEEPFTAFAMAAAAVIFSFAELNEKLGQPVEFIHAPVPHFHENLKKTLELTFGKLLKIKQPMWRNNWAIAPSGNLDEPLYGSEENAAKRRIASPPSVQELRRDKFLKVEYQTIRRLPRSGYLLFTVKTMADPLSSLEGYPTAAACLAKSIRGMSQSMRSYKGIDDQVTCDAVLNYLDSIANHGDGSNAVTN